MTLFKNPYILEFNSYNFKVSMNERMQIEFLVSSTS